jgi:microcystin-dependent protein
MTEFESPPPLRAFLPHQDEQFTARREDGSEVRLRLVDVDTARNDREDWEQFTLRFETTGEDHLGQDTYRVTHPNMDPFDVTITPTRTSDPDPSDCIYEAVFTRHVPDREQQDSLLAGSSPSPRSGLGTVTGLVAGGGVLGGLLSSGDSGGRVRAGGTDRFLGQIMLFAGTYTVDGFALCNGQTLQIQQYQALFSLLGTTYGGDGQTTFALPDLRGRVPVHVANGKPLGATGGTESVQLSTAQLPAHGHGHGDVHVPVSSQEGSVTDPAGNAPAAQPDARGTDPVYTDGATDGTLPAAGSVAETGGGNAHDNMPPYQAVSYQIALTGTYPQRK